MLIKVSISLTASFSIMVKKKKNQPKQNEVKSSKKPKTIQELEKQNGIERVIFFFQFSLLL